jgi:hypothetical protein
LLIVEKIVPALLVFFNQQLKEKVFALRFNAAPLGRAIKSEDPLNNRATHHPLKKFQ